MEPDSRHESTLGAAGRAVQGLLLERFRIGVALMAAVVIAAGLLEGEGAARAFAIVVGLLCLVGWVVSLRARWSDAATWAFVVAAMVAEIAAFTWAVGSGS
jgi:hypothetical protein